MAGSWEIRVEQLELAATALQARCYQRQPLMRGSAEHDDRLAGVSSNNTYTHNYHTHFVV